MTIEFGQLLKQECKRTGLSHSALASKNSVSDRLIRYIIAGKRSPCPAVAENLMNTLQIPIDQQAKFLLLAAGYNPGTIEVSLSVLDSPVSFSDTP